MRKLEVRIGINQSDDNLVEDINGRKNVTGAGINNARRIMDLADASQILVSGIVYENLHLRKKYYGAFTGNFQKVVKHGLTLDIYQLVRTNIAGLNTNLPSSLVSPPKPAEPEPKLPKLTAYYFAHSIKNEKFILNKARESSLNHDPLRLLIWFLAKDSEDKSERSAYDIYTSGFIPDTGSDTIEGHFEWFSKNIPFQVALRLSSVTLDDAIPSSMQFRYFEGLAQNLVINSAGKEKLKREYPEIWDEFKLGELC